MRKLLVALVIAISSTASGQIAQTPSGQPESVFADTDLSEAAGKIASTCMDKGWQITSQGTNMVTCQVPFSGFKQALAGALLGNAYSTPPVIYAQFNMAQIGDNTRVQAHAWMETQMAFGQVRRMDYTDAKTKSGLMSFLVSAGGALPNGTVFNNMNWAGFSNAEKTDANVINVTHVFHNSPAERAGLRRGDQVTALNGKSFKNQQDFDKRKNKVKEATYTLSILRSGEPLTVTLERASVPTVGTPEYAALKSELDEIAKQQRQ